MSEVVLHGYWRSSAAYRVRIALSVKAVDYRQVNHDLRAGAQRDEDYLRIAPHGLVPALAQDDMVLIESPAILEWIETRWPSPALLPADPAAAAIVRAMAALIACDIHPLNNLRVLNALRADFNATPDQIKSWAAHWIGEGFAALETMLESHGGGYAFGDNVTLADCYLAPQIYNAERFGVDLAPFPRIVAAGRRANQLAPFQAAHPSRQLDADA